MIPAFNNTTPVEPGRYPAPFPQAATSDKPVFIKGLYSVVLYLGIGYMLLRRWDLLLVILGVVLLHEAGHFLAMRYFRYADVSILFLPFIGAFVKGSKREISQRQSAIIFLAGPVPGLLLGILIHFISPAHPPIHLGDVPLQLVAQLLIWANLLNLLPVFPLDGGQLLNRVFLNEEGAASTIFFLLSIAVITGAALLTGFYILLALPAFLIYRFFSSKGNAKLDKEIEEAGIDINKTYDELSNEDYWTLRSIVIKHTPALQQIENGPPYHYSDKEDRIAAEIENSLQRNLLLDIPATGKMTVMVVWALCLALPWLLHIDFLLVRYLVR